MAILDLKTSVWGLNRSEFHQKHKYYITKPNQAKTAAQDEKMSTFNYKCGEKKLFPQSPEVLSPSPYFSMARGSPGH